MAAEIGWELPRIDLAHKVLRFAGACTHKFKRDVLDADVGRLRLLCRRSYVISPILDAAFEQRHGWSNEICYDFSVPANRR
jgi:hypothetical protein